MQANNRGPWAVEPEGQTNSRHDDPRNDSLIHQRRIVETIGESDLLIAQRVHKDWAHLVASAPDLLAALKGALEYIEGEHIEAVERHYTHAYTDRRAIAAREAIAKAEGGE